MTWERLLRQIAFALVLFVLINFVDATRIPATAGLRRYLAYAFTTDWDYQGTLAQAKVLASFTGKIRLPGLPTAIAPPTDSLVSPQPQSPQAEHFVPDVPSSNLNPSLLSAETQPSDLAELTEAASSSPQLGPTGLPQVPSSRIETESEEAPAKRGMVWPHTASIVEPFGRRRHPILNIIGLHEGIDIAAPMGSKVLAAENGIVKRLVYNARAGRAIEIEHSGGLSTFYAHLDSIAVHEKDKINKGDVIGLSGRSGLVTGPHLHFEVRKSGQPVDPMPYLSAR